MPDQSDTAESARPPEAIIADYLTQFVGNDNPPEHWVPNARTILRWLADEGWEVERSDGWRNIADDLADVLTNDHFTDDIIPGECRGCDALARYREQASG